MGTNVANGAALRVERTRKAILAAARKLFLRDSFLRTSMDEVAEAAAVSKQTVYAHFGSKEALFLEFVHTLAGAAGDEIRERLAGPDSGRPVADYLTDFAHHQLAIVLTPDLMQLRRLAIAEAGRFPDLGRMLHKMGPGRSIDLLQQAFRQYADAGQLVLADPEEAASNFNWLVMGGPVNDAMMLGPEAIPSAERLEAHATECVRIFLAAYAPPSGTRTG